MVCLPHGLFWRQNCPQLAALRLYWVCLTKLSTAGCLTTILSLFVLQNSYLNHVQLCSHSQLIMWLAHGFWSVHLSKTAQKNVPVEIISPRHQHLSGAIYVWALALILFMPLSLSHYGLLCRIWCTVPLTCMNGKPLICSGPHMNCSMVKLLYVMYTWLHTFRCTIIYVPFCFTKYFSVCLLDFF